MWLTNWIVVGRYDQKKKVFWSISEGNYWQQELVKSVKVVGNQQSIGSFGESKRKESVTSSWQCELKQEKKLGNKVKLEGVVSS